jgi:type I restriction enzyme, S subunit
MKKYDSYTDWGVDWIGKIPSHWNHSNLKWYAKIYSGGTPSKDVEEYWINGTIPWLNSGSVNQGDIVEASEYITQKAYSNSSAKWISEGSLILALAGQGKTKGMVAQVKFKTTCNQSLGVIVPNDKINNRFLLYWIRSNYQNIRNLGGGDKRDGLNLVMLGAIPIPIPTLLEQAKISIFLDQKIAQIDHLIAKKESLIQLLEEERVSVITQAVTKGLDPNVPMKDSGIEWLGEIPEHWEVKRMRFLCDITTGGKDTENREDNGLYPFYVRSQTIERISSYSFDGEAILTAGDGVGVCKVWHYVNGRFDFHQRVYMMSNFQFVLGKYLFYYLKENFGKEVMKLSAKSTVDSLRRPMFQNFMIPFGTLIEQEQIILKIEKEEIRLQNIIDKTKEEIQLLIEYKDALISEVVTGKLDVRNEKLN